LHRLLTRRDDDAVRPQIDGDINAALVVSEKRRNLQDHEQRIGDPGRARVLEPEEQQIMWRTNVKPIEDLSGPLYLLGARPDENRVRFLVGNDREHAILSEQRL
jgi:hypothetical protein